MPLSLSLSLFPDDSILATGYALIWERSRGRSKECRYSRLEPLPSLCALFLQVRIIAYEFTRAARARPSQPHVGFLAQVQPLSPWYWQHVVVTATVTILPFTSRAAASSRAAMQVHEELRSGVPRGGSRDAAAEERPLSSSV